MRPMALLISILVLGAAFAGCVGQAGEDDPTKSSTGGTNPGTDAGPSTPSELKVLAPLLTTVTKEGEEWVAPGSKVKVAASPPANAKGDVTYTWAIGPLPQTVAVTDAGLNTKDIAPGASSKLTFDKAGVYNMHCHPHPFMLANVTVIDGYAGAKEATVYIVDGANLGEFRFVPEHVVIPTGGSVVYKNVGTQMHTATQAGQEPELKAADLNAASGELTVDGTGWQRILVIAQDADGRIGRAEQRIYVAPLPEAFADTFSFEFKAGIPAQAPSEANTEIGTKTFKLTHAGSITLNFTVADAPSQNGAPVNLALVDVHLKESGATQDTLTAEAKAEGTLTGIVGAKNYELTVIPRQGVMGKFEITIDVVYDLVPPAPAQAAAPGGGDGHGGHAHH